MQSMPLSRAGELWRSYARDPAKLVRLQQFLIAICLLWSLISVSQLIWFPGAHRCDRCGARGGGEPAEACGWWSIGCDRCLTVLGSGLFGPRPSCLRQPWM
ncbi:MAG: hypothetical protein CM15mP74_01960 [Halieaceae bacterium]|nr:MAG: hypothetical protein CM15mP74_01960 [Halieaceae bacterium]